MTQLEQSGAAGDLNGAPVDVLGTQSVAARRVLHLDDYVPYFLAALNNALSAGASTTYRREFGLGVTAWRVLSSVALEHGVAANRIVALVALDKAAVSRALADLHERGLVKATASPSDPRRKTYAMTDAGWDLHDRMLTRALDRQETLIKGIAPEDLAACLRALRIMRDNVLSPMSPPSDGPAQ